MSVVWFIVGYLVGGFSVMLAINIGFHIREGDRYAEEQRDRTR